MRKKRSKALRKLAEQIVIANGGDLSAPRYLKFNGVTRYGALAPNTTRSVYRFLKRTYKQVKGNK